MSTIPKRSDPVPILVKAGYVLAQRLEADERLKDLGPQVRAAADRLQQAGDGADVARREAWLRRDIRDQGAAKALAALRVAELEVRMNGEGSRDTVAHRTLFPDGVSAYQQGRQPAKMLRMKALVEAMAGTPELAARTQALQEALVAWEQSESAFASARLARHVAVQSLDAARAAFLSQYRAAFGFATGRLGDTGAARAVFPDLGHAAMTGIAVPAAVPAAPVTPVTPPASSASPVHPAV